jgi:hypothetical protein
MRGVEFDAECEFDYTTRETPPDYVPYGEGSVPMGGGLEVDSVTPDAIIPRESICIAARETLIQRGFPNNARTRKHARFIARNIMRDLSRAPVFSLIDEDDFTDEALESL